MVQCTMDWAHMPKTSVLGTDDALLLWGEGQCRTMRLQDKSKNLPPV